MNAEEVCSGKGLFFIIGCGRSGTTLLKSILNGNKEVMVTPETFYYSSISKFEFILSKVDYATKVRLVLSRWWFKDIKVYAEKKEKKRCNKLGDWDDIFINILIKIAGERLEGLKCLGEKTPAHMYSIDRLKKNFPKAKIVQIFRDPRAVAASYKNQNFGHVTVSGSIREWVYAKNVHDRMLANSDYYFLRYEDLVLNPENELNKLCEFLGVDFCEGMLHFYNRKDLGFSKVQSHHLETKKPITIENKDKWVRYLSHIELNFLSYFVSEVAKDIGYEIEASQQASRAKLRLFDAINMGYEFLYKNFILRVLQKLKAIKSNRLRT